MLLLFSLFFSPLFFFLSLFAPRRNHVSKKTLSLPLSLSLSLLFSPLLSSHFFSFAYSSSTLAWYLLSSCGLLSLKVGVSVSSSTEKWRSSRWSAFTASNPFSLASFPVAVRAARTCLLTSGLAQSSARGVEASASEVTPAAASDERSAASAGTTTATSADSNELP